MSSAGVFMEENANSRENCHILFYFIKFNNGRAINANETKLSEADRSSAPSEKRRLVQKADQVTG